MRINRKIFFAPIFVFLGLSPPSLSAETITPFTMPSARHAALGGNHAALADDFDSLFNNPASFAAVEDEFSVAELSFGAYGPVFEILDLTLGHTDSLEDLDLSGIIGDKGFAAGFDLGGPVSAGWVGRGLGFGLFSRFSAGAAATGSNLKAVVSGDVFLLGGYSFRVINRERHVLDTGFLGKGFLRMGVDLKSTIFTVETLFDDTDKLPFTTALGIGFDLGLKYTFAEKLSAALVCFDVYSPAMVTTYNSFDDFKNKENPREPGHYALVKPRLNLGLQYRIRSFFLEKYISHLIILADYRDFIDLFSLIPRNPVLNFGFGLEAVILDKLSLRIGVADALPSAGFGLNLSFMRFDCAIHGKELGFDPGIQSTYALAFSLLFRY
ncbi:MAG: hypothetical protein LBS57_04295 [Treponema sp.]|jgi:hypothetical protein|nr:hypothetical protein [Treponema sp.]